MELNSLKERSIQEVHIQLKRDAQDELKLRNLRDFLVAKEGQCSVYFHIDTDQGPYIVKAASQLRVPCAQDFIEDLSEQEEVQEVWLA